ncbi:MAG TPA: hypothetical protein VFB45_10035 [Pseudolabrys sp.]|nr:hypothetical protein [Pseudolabrys sp.]
MKTYLKLSAVIGILGATALMAASPSIAATKRHVARSVAAQSYALAPDSFVGTGQFGNANDPTSYEGHVVSEGN